MVVLGTHNDFTVYFNAEASAYTVHYKGKVLIPAKYHYVDIQSYLGKCDAVRHPAQRW
jgi:hypothetical protein